MLPANIQGIRRYLPLVLVAFVAHTYIHPIPTAGNDLVPIGLLASIGLTLGGWC